MKVLAVTVFTLYLTAFALAVTRAHASSEEPNRTLGWGQVRFEGLGPERWAQRYRQEHERTLQLRAQLRHRWHPTVSYALRLASAVSGVPLSDLTAVSRCESTFNPYATNGRYLGLFQLSWSPFGFSPFDPIANALSAALTVRRDGGWRQWSCRP